MDLAELLPKLLCVAWLLPLASFTIIVFLGPRLGKNGVLASYVATGAILSGFVLSAVALVAWLGNHGAAAPGGHHDAAHDQGGHAAVASTSPMRLASLAKPTHVDTEEDAHDEHAGHHEVHAPV